MPSYVMIISEIIAVCSIIIAFFQFVKWLIEKFTIVSIPIIGKCFSWRKINLMVKKICKKINQAPEPFSSIVGIGRGGAIFSSLMSYELDKVPFVLVVDRKYKIVDEIKETIIIADNVEFKQKFRKLLDEPVLLVSQRADPGTTINAYRSFLKKIGFKRISVCAVLVSENNCCADIPYFYKKYGSNKRTKSFPWFYKKPNIMTEEQYFL